MGCLKISRSSIVSASIYSTIEKQEPSENLSLERVTCKLELTKKYMMALEAHVASVSAYCCAVNSPIYTYRPTPNRAESLREVMSTLYHNACRPKSHAHRAAWSRTGGLYKRLLMWRWKERDAVNDLQPCWAARAQQGPLDR